ncbi:MAG: c-type cytochrome biogenesis protein CcmI [Methyloceanibacter sp.]
MLLWLILACLTAIVLLVLLRPLARESEGDATEAASSAREGFDAAVYRDQLAEIDADRARGLIGEAEAEAARIEIARRLLATDGKARASAGAQREGATSRAALIGVTALLPLVALGFYLSYGSPGLPDQPLALRLKDPANEQNIAALVARVEARLREHPEDGEGWDVIAPVYLGWRRYGDAANAYEQAIRLLGPSASRLSGLGQALVLKNDGLVTEEARRALERALTLDKTLLETRILLSIAKEQDGKLAEAVEAWRALLQTADTNAPWREMVEQRIALAEAKRDGKPLPQPSAQDVAAAEAMSPAERQAMIESMVQRLAARLETQGDDLPGWLKLVRAYSVLHRKDEATKALARAKSQFTGNAAAIRELDALAAELGLKS